MYFIPAEEMDGAGYGDYKSLVRQVATK